MLKKVQIFKALDIEIKKQKGPASVKDAYRGHHSLKEELSQPGISVIAEVAGGSPLRGQVRENYRPATHARSLLENGARAISVATDRFLYWGDDRHLPEVRAQAKVPLLRRDFIFEEYQIEESKILGADAIFLMACLLEPERLRDLHKLAIAKSLDVVFEIFDEADLERALAADAEIVCVVGRDMDTWEPSFERALELLQKVPEDKCFRMVEAGVMHQTQIQQLDDMGVQGVIIGEVFLDEFYPGKRLAQILAGIEPSKKAPKIRPKLDESLADMDLPETVLPVEDEKTPTQKKSKADGKSAAKGADSEAEPVENKKPVKKAPEKKTEKKLEKKADAPAKPESENLKKSESKPEKKVCEKKTCEKKAGEKKPAEKAEKSAPKSSPAETQAKKPAPAKEKKTKEAAAGEKPSNAPAKKAPEKKSPAKKNTEN